MTKKFVLQNIFESLSLEMKNYDFKSCPKKQKFIR